MDTFLKILGGVVLFLVILVVVGLLVGYPAKWIINYLFAPSALQAVFGVARITFWQAFWLNILCGILFKASASSVK
jgi:uncharacterized membrane protein YjjP (DUF1212 family)